MSGASRRRLQARALAAPLCMLSLFGSNGCISPGLTGRDVWLDTREKNPGPSLRALPQVELGKLSEPAHIAAIQGFLLPVLGEQDCGFAHEVARCLHPESTLEVADLNAWRDLIPGIMAAHQKGRKIVVMAHSLGNNNILEGLAPAMQDLGIGINLWIMVDASYLDSRFPFPPMPEHAQIPGGVDRVLCFYGDDLWWNGRSLRQDDFAPRDAYATMPLYESALLPGGHVGMAQPGNVNVVASRAAALLQTTTTMAMVEVP